jgi:hypothetical protein
MALASMQELQKYRAILLATLDYENARTAANVPPERTEQSAQINISQGNYIQKLFAAGDIDTIKKRLHIYTELYMQLGNTAYGEYIKKTTGYDFDIFENIQGRVEKIIEKNIIKNKKERADAIAMIELCRKGLYNQAQVPKLHNLLKEYRNSTNSKHQGFQVNYLLELNSPDLRNWVTVYEINGSTQVQIDSKRRSVLICQLKGTNLFLDIHWRDNQTIVIATKKGQVFEFKYSPLNKKDDDMIVAEYVEI